MKFWNSKVVAGMYKNSTFVTREDNFDRNKFLYTARLYDWENHRVINISKFQQFSSLQEASDFARTYDVISSISKKINLLEFLKIGGFHNEQKKRV